MGRLIPAGTGADNYQVVQPSLPDATVVSALGLFGESEDGELVDIEGSWTAGVDGAKPGILMLAAPAIGDVYRQELLLREAEDVGEVVPVEGDELAASGGYVNVWLRNGSELTGRWADPELDMALAVE